MAAEQATAPTWPIAAGSLALGFAVAEVTGVRAIGGVVLLVALAWCVPRWQKAGQHATLLLGVYIAAFVASHLIGALIGAWPAVAITALTVGAITYRVENR